MLGVMQTIANSTENLTYQDVEYLAYQLIQKHGKTTVINMDTQTVNDEINNIIRGNNNGS